jgi:hypothetical protein
MKEWVKIIAGSIGPVFGLSRFVIDFVQERHPMNFESWAFWLMVLCSSVYGVYALAVYMVGLDARMKKLEARPTTELGRIAAEVVKQMPTFQGWSREQIDALPEGEKNRLKKENKPLWEWYLGKPN